jgi:uncharacterized protein (DUF2235 family)
MDTKLPKDLVLCLDGTGNEFGDSNSNVVKLYATLNQSDRQVCYYHPGLGTRGDPNALTKLAKVWTQLIGMAFGYGMSSNLADAYSFIMAEYEPGDRVFIFGFSRGAYTARALCGMLHMFGLLRRHEEVLIYYMIRMMRKANQKETFEIAKRFDDTFSRKCPIYFLGVWDTVSSVGWVYSPVVIPYTRNNPDIHIARHAISLDECRGFYRQNLLGDPLPGQDFQQKWFPGVHSDVGGSYPENESGLSKIALKWMLDEARTAGLSFDEAKVGQVLGETDSAYAPADPAAKLHTSLYGGWWVLEFFPKCHKVKTPDGEWVKRWELPMGKPRAVPPDAVIHPSVEERRKRVPEYQPVNLAPGTAVHRPRSAQWRLAGILAAGVAAGYLVYRALK